LGIHWLALAQPRRPTPLWRAFIAPPQDENRKPYVPRGCNERRQVLKITGAGIKFTDDRAVEIIDLRIIYEKGAPIAYVRPLTIHGRRWLWKI
jgi:hypothetical protein